MSFFAWTADWGRILTHDNLIMRGPIKKMIILIERGFTLVAWCCMCRCSGKIVAHLLLHCNVIYVLWSRALGAFGVQWVLPAAVADLLFGLWNWLGKHSSDIWNIVP